MSNCYCSYCGQSGIPRINIPLSTSSELDKLTRDNEILFEKIDRDSKEAFRVVAQLRDERDRLTRDNQELLNQHADQKANIAAYREQIRLMMDSCETIKREYVQLFNRHNATLAKLDEIKGIVK